MNRHRRQERQELSFSTKGENKIIPLSLQRPKTLSTKTHQCPHCGIVPDRDENAALNILTKGLSTAGHVGISAWGENDLWKESGNRFR
ncbi:transposase [Fischerella thermalis WC246]|uniref:Transposase IS605 OrfB n=2 Tax=Fischerella TaxID=1190 RepID=G6FSD1_9CYAN|nr:transposase IS605 OrfB [Fischerella thermalis JSC-11]PLZ06186.1 transposase [Fischerella thermalis WC1110]PLZ13132.1 transposase [Fischerella thermalis WC119]PLZ14225.1 transposase [Fischerella thermalis WC114]PLZ20178.1 transposase [Fischerella thermalis WC157]PLZ25688.1 transposase [Fischerella thermalis WC341]PLZ36910.1 transposase [Fischerella thermalis WC538]PLZ43463.1 transposase [Fischerella thermalis WC527]PLZ50198.1 transposase [Fischerella thermalis WC441]PLZ57484.1 transposas